MEKLAEFQTRIERGSLDRILATLYGRTAVTSARDRYIELLAAFGRKFGTDREITIVSAPGRTELGGNHTDHNNGRVLAGSVHLDCLAAVAGRDDNQAVLWSAGYDVPFQAKMDELNPIASEEGSTSALIRGVARGFTDHGLVAGGFDAYVDSKVLPGSGLSSSAAIEVAIGSMLSHLYNGGRVDRVTIAQIGQFAENEFFGKPCGLMDQTACSCGGIIAIDFADPRIPAIERVAYSFEEAGFRLMVVNTGGSHADLTPDYAAVAFEMKSIARAMEKSFLRQTDLSAVLSSVASLRRQTGDRAILRAMHFFADNNRVEQQIAALRANDVGRYLALVRESGDSSWRLLQNCYSTQTPAEQGIPLATALTELFLIDQSESATAGAARVHGGGFAGTAQVYIPLELESSYIGVMESVFGAGSVTPLSIRAQGAMAVAGTADPV
ncbi:MAG TPA: galactokinase family protein [Spirochaetia bacterium]|nr:galactokinase family protein [Spirochaetia bacterium]